MNTTGTNRGGSSRSPRASRYAMRISPMTKRRPPTRSSLRQRPAGCWTTHVDFELSRRHSQSFAIPSVGLSGRYVQRSGRTQRNETLRRLVWSLHLIDPSILHEAENAADAEHERTQKTSRGPTRCITRSFGTRVAETGTGDSEVRRSSEGSRRPLRTVGSRSHRYGARLARVDRRSPKSTGKRRRRIRPNPSTRSGRRFRCGCWRAGISCVSESRARRPRRLQCRLQPHTAKHAHPPSNPCPRGTHEAPPTQAHLAPSSKASPKGSSTRPPLAAPVRRAPGDSPGER